MDKITGNEKRSKGRRTGRIGQPPQELAGEVDARILDAAHRVFLERGLDGASMGEIASLARAGKPTIYARFPNKEALFTAVVMQSIAATVARYSAHETIGATIEERLKSVAVTMLEWILVSDSIRLMRIAIAEASRFPDLATSVFGMGRERAAQAVARLLAEAAQSDELGTLQAFAPERLTSTTQFCQDLVLLPLVLRALFGEKLKQLRAEIGPHVTRSVAFFLAACRNGGVN